MPSFLRTVVLITLVLLISIGLGLALGLNDSPSGSSTHAVFASPHSQCGGVFIRLRPGRISATGTFDSREVSPDQPKTVIAAGFPLYPGAGRSHRGVTKVSNTTGARYFDEAVAFYTASVTPRRGIAWYRRAFPACGFRETGDSFYRDSDPSVQVGIFESELNPALKVTLKLKRLSIGTSSIVYFAAASAPPIRPAASFVPASPAKLTVSDVVRIDRAGRSMGYRISLTRAAARGSSLCCAVDEAVRLLAGLLNQSRATATPVICSGGGATPPTVTQWLAIKSASGQTWHVHVLPNVCGGVLIEGAGSQFTNLGCDETSCIQQWNLVSQAIDTLVQAECAVHHCRLVRLDPPSW